MKHALRSLTASLLLLGLVGVSPADEPTSRASETANELFEQDRQFLVNFANADLPIRVGVFPVDDYESPGAGNGPLNLTIGGRTFVGQYALVGRSPDSAHLYGDLPEDATGATFAVVLALADDQKREGGGLFVSSRNHPAYLAEGRMPLPNDYRVDWLAVTRPDADDLIVVNAKVFDPKQGRLVVVIPHEDGTVRFVQVDAGPFRLDDFDMLPEFRESIRRAAETTAVLRELASPGVTGGVDGGVDGGEVDSGAGGA